MILDREVEKRWLDPDLEDGQAALSYLQPVPPDQFEAYPVSSLVSSARNEGPELIEPAEDAPAGAPPPLLAPQPTRSAHRPCPRGNHRGGTRSANRALTWPTVSSRP